MGPITASLVSPSTWTSRAWRAGSAPDQALYAAKAGGRNRVYVDRRGSSDLRGPPRHRRACLTWQEASECGERQSTPSTADFQSRQCVDRRRDQEDSTPTLWRAALDSLLTHVVGPSEMKRRVLARHGYDRLARTTVRTPRFCSGPSNSGPRQQRRRRVGPAGQFRCQDVLPSTSSRWIGISTHCFDATMAALSDRSH